MIRVTVAILAIAVLAGCKAPNTPGADCSQVGKRIVTDMVNQTVLVCTEEGDGRKRWRKVDPK